MVFKYLRSISFIQFLKSSTETLPKQSLGLTDSWEVSIDKNKTEKSRVKWKKKRIYFWTWAFDVLRLFFRLNYRNVFLHQSWDIFFSKK